MPILTIDALQENPWSVVSHELPPQPPRLLLELAYLAADYCRTSEFLLMEAARLGSYVPCGWMPGDDSPDVHEASEARWCEADARLAVISELLAQQLAS